MTPSLYEITEDLRGIINELETNGGELTEELAEALEVTETNFREKLDNYRKALIHLNSIVDCSKAEKKRLNERQKVKENIIARLKGNILLAVEEFGDTGKSGNKIIELDDATFYTKKTKSLVYDEDRVALLNKTVFMLLQELVSSGILVTGEEIDLHGFLDTINLNARAEFANPDDFIPFTIGDLDSSIIEFTAKKTITELLTHDGLAQAILSHSEDFTSQPVEDKDNLKFNIIQTAGTPNEVTIGREVYTNSLCIK